MPLQAFERDRKKDKLGNLIKSGLSVHKRVVND